MKKFNWQQIEGLVKGFYPNGITPILAFASEFPIKLKSGLSTAIGLPDHADERYTFYASLAKRRGEYLITVQAFSVRPAGELIPVLIESKSFLMSEKNKAEVYLKAPLGYFNMEGHIRLITFKDTHMKEQEFKEIIELWRTQPSQIKT